MPTAARIAHGIPPPIWLMQGPDEMRLPSWNHLTCTCQTKKGCQQIEGRTCEAVVVWCGMVRVGRSEPATRKSKSI